MKSVIEYDNYRAYMQDFYDNRKRTSVFSWREFAKQAGFSSPTYLKLVCEGKSGLSQIGVERTAAAMGLVGFELVYFRALVLFGQAKQDEDKKKAYAEMQEIAKAHKVRVLDGETFKFYESWKYPVLRELATIMPGAKPLTLAKMCHQEITAMEVREVLHDLVAMGLLKKTGEDVYEQAERSLEGSAEALPVAIRTMHRDMARFAEGAVDDFGVNERSITGITMGLGAETYGRVLKILEDCRRQIVDVVSAADDAERVYRLNLQLFPLTAKKMEVSDGQDS